MGLTTRGSLGGFVVERAPGQLLHDRDPTLVGPVDPPVVLGIKGGAVLVTGSGQGFKEWSERGPGGGRARALRDSFRPPSQLLHDRDPTLVGFVDQPAVSAIEGGAELVAQPGQGFDKWPERCGRIRILWPALPQA